MFRYLNHYSYDKNQFWEQNYYLKFERQRIEKKLNKHHFF
ncbi:Hypothetical protein Ccan_19430 [Capnocytophaga canimorsus Cc5]|uniref:Uncharacterized protein n=1 Tax=Capnocytophaga canimorsus (strain 5) TaxID=860228 RepID=F9YTL4_CAPCC|nr:Hypothetical protein Ccan_19430 [Capnocytophaga canimorsus Cc5]